MDFELSYCANVFPVETADDLLRVIRGELAALRSELKLARLDAGLHIPAQAAAAIVNDPKIFDALETAIGESGLRVRTLNGFPYGSFHAERVKEAVYLPDWTRAERTSYTIDLARILARLMPNHASGSISTVAGGFKPELSSKESLRYMAINLARVARELNHIYVEQGRDIVLCLEPEPFTTLETTPETITFFRDQLWNEGWKEVSAEHGEPREVAESILRRHIGVCYDCCHQAVEYENAETSLKALKDAGIRVGKMQLSNALEMRNVSAVERLREYAEPRYLHQSVARLRDGTLHRFLDLLDVLEAIQKGAPIRSARTHFHVPLFYDEPGDFGSTQKELLGAIRAARALDITHHYEIETYTWPVLPGTRPIKDDMIANLAREYRWARENL